METLVLIPRSYASRADQGLILEHYKTLRLTGLKEDPQAFSSTYEKEVEFSDERWLARITNPEAKTFVALKGGREPPSTLRQSDKSVASLLEGDWIGTVTSLGPKICVGNNIRSRAPWNLFIDPDACGASGDDDTKAFIYMLTGMLVLRAERRRGHGRRLIERLVKDARHEAEEASIDCVVLLALVDAENEPAHATYTQCGFEVWGDQLLLESRDGVERTIVMALEIMLK